jgi:hypothetical protein
MLDGAAADRDRKRQADGDQKPGMALATHSPHISTAQSDNSAFCTPRPRRCVFTGDASATWSGATEKPRVLKKPTVT